MGIVPPTYHATFTSDARSTTLARTAVARFAFLCGFGADPLAEIVTAAGEALADAAQQSRSKRGGGFSVTCTFVDGELRIEVQRSQNGTDAEHTSEYGTIIMRSLMNDVSYSRGGTRVRLVKRLLASS